MTAHPAYRLQAVLRRPANFFRPPRPQRRAQSTKTDGSAPNTAPVKRPSATSAPVEQQVPTPNNVPTLPLWQRLGPLTRVAQAYGRSQRKRPLITQVCTSLVIFSLGDTFAQRVGGKEYDPTRTGRSLIIGGISSIPSYKWFMFLSHSFNYSSKVLSLVTKIAVNQACFTPIFNSYFFGMQSLLSGDSLPEVWDRIRRTVPTSVVNSLKLWPAVTAVNFTFVPIEFRSVFAGVVAVGWQTYLSFLNRRAEEEEERARQLAAAAAQQMRHAAKAKAPAIMDKMMA